MFNKSLFGAFAAATVLGFAGFAKADTITSVNSAGTFTSDSSHYITETMTANAYSFTDLSQAPQYSGSVRVTGVSGSLAVNFGAPVASVYFDTVPINGVNYSRAHISTGKFFFANLATGQKTLATAEVDVIKAGARGMVCFHVVSVANGSTLAITCDSAGNLIDLPLTSGNTTITSR